MDLLSNMHVSNVLAETLLSGSPQSRLEKVLYFVNYLCYNFESYFCSVSIFIITNDLYIDYYYYCCCCWKSLLYPI